MITTVTGKNQITIPAALARKYQLEPGSCLEWRDGGQVDQLCVIVHPGPKALLRSVRELGARYGTAPDSAVVVEKMREDDDESTAKPTSVYKMKKRARS